MTNECNKLLVLNVNKAKCIALDVVSAYSLHIPFLVHTVSSLRHIRSCDEL